jgi:hypothetical protein
MLKATFSRKVPSGHPPHSSAQQSSYNLLVNLVSFELWVLRDVGDIERLSSDSCALLTEHRVLRCLVVGLATGNEAVALVAVFGLFGGQRCGVFIHKSGSWTCKSLSLTHAPCHRAGARVELGLSENVETPVVSGRKEHITSRSGRRSADRAPSTCGARGPAMAQPAAFGW